MKVRALSGSGGGGSVPSLAGTVFSSSFYVSNGIMLNVLGINTLQYKIWFVSNFTQLVVIGVKEDGTEVTIATHTGNSAVTVTEDVANYVLLKMTRNGSATATIDTITVID